MTRVLRYFDIVLSCFGILLLWPVGVVILIIGVFDTGSPLFIQERVGRNLKMFRVIKFRTMNKGTASVATHLTTMNSTTSFGSLLRRTKLDELPQLWNVLRGEMSMVGPRPNLFNQTDLINERLKRGVYLVRPGITGLAQINKIDMSTPEHLAMTDEEMIRTLTPTVYFKYIVLTIIGKGSGDRIGVD